MDLTLIAKTQLSDNAWAFTFRPAQPLSWIAGQFVRIEVPHAAPDAGGTNRRFTIAAAPHEHDLTIATRIGPSTFKQALAKLPVGVAIKLLDTPAGDFVWRQAPQPHIFVAQGIGITPFYAIIKDRIARRQPVQAHLFYAHQPHLTPLFADELASWAATDPSLRVTIQTHPVTPAQLAADVSDLTERFVYVSGPKPLIALCLPPYNLPAGRLKQDNFPGYAAASY